MELIAFDVQMHIPHASEAAPLWGLTRRARGTAVPSRAAGYALTALPHPSQLQSLYPAGKQQKYRSRGRGFTRPGGGRHGGGPPHAARSARPRCQPPALLSASLPARCGARLPLHPRGASPGPRQGWLAAGRHPAPPPPAGPRAPNAARPRQQPRHSALPNGCRAPPPRPAAGEGRAGTRQGEPEPGEGEGTAAGRRAPAYPPLEPRTRASGGSTRRDPGRTRPPRPRRGPCLRRPRPQREGITHVGPVRFRGAAATRRLPRQPCLPPAPAGGLSLTPRSPSAARRRWFCRKQSQLPRKQRRWRMRGGERG